jgi:TonB-dependent starch-binding outer membrane protein SusC
MMSHPLPARRALTLACLLVLVPACVHSRTAGSGETRAEGAGADVSAEEIGQNRAQPIEQILMSRVPGLWVTRTADGGVAMRIRGATSIHGSNEPLFVIDGMPVLSGPNGSLTGINPYDIASIRVLKDATDVTMYGLRGANGVILVTTKVADQE